MVLAAVCLVLALAWTWARGRPQLAGRSLTLRYKLASQAMFFELLGRLFHLGDQQSQEVELGALIFEKLVEQKRSVGEVLGAVEDLVGDLLDELFAGRAGGSPWRSGTC